MDTNGSFGLCELLVDEWVNGVLTEQPTNSMVGLCALKSISIQCKFAASVKMCRSGEVPCVCKTQARVSHDG